MKQARRLRGRSTTVRLQDLDPRGDVRGGTGKRVFGEQTSHGDERHEAVKERVMAKKKSASKAKPSAKGKTRAKAKTLSPKDAGKVKGGVTLASSTLVSRKTISTSIAKPTISTKLYE
jgi:hypothetical protein